MATMKLSVVLDTMQQPASTPATTTGLQLQRMEQMRYVQLPAHLPETVRQAAALAVSDAQPVRALTLDDLSDELLLTLSGTAMLLGHTKTLKDPKDLRTFADEVAGLIKRKFAFLRLDEVGQACRLGAAGEWLREGERLIVSLPTIAHWLTCYSRQVRSEAIRQLEQAQLASRPQLLLAPPDPAAQYPQMVAACAEHVRRLGRFPSPVDPGGLMAEWLVYAWLKKIGAFRGFKTPAQYGEMLRKESIKLSQSKPLAKTERAAVDSFGVLLRQGWPAGHPLAETVEGNCAKRLLREWLRYHVAKGTDLQAWLTELAHHHQHAA